MTRLPLPSWFCAPAMNGVVLRELVLRVGNVAAWRVAL